MINKTIISGFGGQGVMLIGQILGQCAFEQNLYATVLPTYGVEQRGGTANTTVAISDARIASPVADHPDMLCALNQPSIDRYIGAVKEGGCVLVNTSQADAACIKRTDITVIPVPADDLAFEIGSMKVANIIILGVYAGYTGVVSYDTLKSVVKHKLSKKPEFDALNSAALEKGFALGRKAAKA